MSEHGLSAGQLALAVIAGWSAWRGAARLWRGDGVRPAVGWGLIAVGAWVWAWGEAVRLVHLVVLGEAAPLPSLADAGSVAMPLLVAAGLVAWSAGNGGLRDHAGDVLDGVVVGASLVLLAWTTVLSDSTRRVGADELVLSVAAAAPLADGLALTLLVLVLSRTGRGGRAPVLALGTGLAALALADGASAYSVSAGGPGAGPLVDVLRLVGLSAVALAGRAAASAVPGQLRLAARGRRGVPRAVLTVAPAAVALGVVCARLLAEQVVPDLQIACLVGMAAALAVRHVVAAHPLPA